MEWVFLGALIATFVAAIVVLMLVMLLFPFTRWIILGLGVSALAATLFFTGGAKMEWTASTIAVVTIAAVLLAIAIPVLYWNLGLWRLPIRPQIVGPEDMAILVILGEPEEFLDSGLHWFPLFFGCFLKLFPKKMYNLDYTAREVVTRRGTEDGIEYGAQILTADSVAYVRFPQFYVRFQYKDKQGKTRTKIVRETVKSEKEFKRRRRELKNKGILDIEVKGGLVEIYRQQIPTDEAELKNFTEEAIVGALRVAIGKVTWRKATEDIEDVRKEAEEVFKSSDGALLTAGFHPDDLRLAIEEIKLPRELAQALPEPDKARLDAQAAKFVSQTRAIETVGTVIEMMAQSRGKTPEEIRDSIEADSDAQAEFLRLSQDLIKRRMAIDGDSFVDIRVEGADGIEKTLLNLVAAWQRMPPGRKPKEKEEKKGRPVRVPGGTRVMDEEERKRLGLP